MPPQRTAPPTKAVKTERTHEENQERAYIAASRRSDRSLEARIESARRASAIHKRRTGRALRVTEQDVINEEMYEEEDDCYSHQGLAHLRNTNQDFNLRLQAYLQHRYFTHANVAHTLGADGGNPSSRPYSGMPSNFPPQFMHQPMSTPYSNSPMQQSQLSPTTYAPLRQQPYPSTGAAPHRYHRAMSMQIPTSMHLQNYQPGVHYPNQPIYSAPTSPASGIALGGTTGQYPTQLMPQHQPGIISQHFPRQSVPLSAKSPTPLAFDDPLLGFPFTTALPAETQQFLQPVLDPNDPLYPTLMAGHSSTPLFGFDNGANDLKSSISDPAPSLTASELQSSPLSFSSMATDPRGLDGGGGVEPLFEASSGRSIPSSTSLSQTPVSPQSDASIPNDAMLSPWHELIDEEIWHN